MVEAVQQPERGAGSGERDERGGQRPSGVGERGETGAGGLADADAGDQPGERLRALALGREPVDGQEAGGQQRCEEDAGSAASTTATAGAGSDSSGNHPAAKPMEAVTRCRAGEPGQVWRP